MSAQSVIFSHEKEAEVPCRVFAFTTGLTDLYIRFSRCSGLIVHIPHSEISIAISKEYQFMVAQWSKFIWNCCILILRGFLYGREGGRNPCLGFKDRKGTSESSLSISHLLCSHALLQMSQLYSCMESESQLIKGFTFLFFLCTVLCNKYPIQQHLLFLSISDTQRWGFLVGVNLCSAQRCSAFGMNFHSYFSHVNVPCLWFW